MRAAAQEAVGTLVTLRINLNREGGIFAEKHGRIPFGMHNPSFHVHDLRLQAQQALQTTRANLVTQAGAVKKLIDSIFGVIAEYEGIDVSVREELERLTAQLAEIEGTTHGQ